MERRNQDRRDVRRIAVEWSIEEGKSKMDVLREFLGEPKEEKEETKKPSLLSPEERKRFIDVYGTLTGIILGLTCATYCSGKDQ
jgi:hypothetical protein